MQIPALIKGILERMLNVCVMESPGAMNDLAVLRDLFRFERWSTFNKTEWRDGHDIRGPIREPDAGARKRNLHHMFRKVAGWMHHVLMRCCDITTRRVVVSSKVCGHTATARRCQQQRKIYFTTSIYYRLCGFDHHLELQSAGRQTGLLFQQLKKIGQRANLFGNRNLRLRYFIVVGQLSA